MLGITEDLRLCAFHTFGSDDDLLDGQVRGDHIHDLCHHIFHNSAKTSGADLSVNGFFRHSFQCFFLDLKFYIIQLKQLFVLFDQRVFGFNKNPDQIFNLIQD